ncbi:MAG: prepilin-type N-terminal cleavage/methylation domain-containing protein [Longimicrobiales bacterium]|nr:prepilin-type N-terminal cleavage/methylation domain-containing protein [Longimicrobiales bacterium]
MRGAVKGAVKGVCAGRARAGDRGRHGFTLPEALTALLLLGLLLGLLARASARLRGTLERVAVTAERVESARVARHLVEHIVAGGGAIADGASADEIRVELSVGWAAPCDSVWGWRGIRQPDPVRDSALVIDDASRVVRVAVDAVTPRPCASGVGLALRFAPEVDGAVFVRVFEVGAVRVDDAVRYGRWGSARQPLTAAVLEAGASGLAREGGALHLTVVADSVHRWERWWPLR